MIDPRYELDIAQMKRRGEFLRWFFIIGNLVCLLFLIAVQFRHGLPFSARLTFGICALACIAFSASAYKAGR